jgi:5-methylthioribose kinase
MEEIDASNLLDYFRGAGEPRLPQLELSRSDLNEARVTELAWGVSNIVLRVDVPHSSFVVKQSRDQLRTEIDWFSGIERIWREVDVMRTLGRLLPNGAVPHVLFEDRDNYLFAMEAVEADHRVWKADLLEGRFDTRIAEPLACYLATIQRGSTDVSESQPQLADRTNFDELRLDPFYRHMARNIDALAEPLNCLIDDTLARRDCLVLADFSPKNILLTSRGPVLVDFETGHCGDPGFDIGFFLSHLLLKAVRHADRLAEIIELPRRFWAEYVARIGTAPVPAWLNDLDRTPTFERQCVRHLAACMLSRVDGKSRVDYLTESWQTELVREFSRNLLINPIDSINDAFDQLVDMLSSPR